MHQGRAIVNNHWKINNKPQEENNINELISQNCIKPMIKDILEINDVVLQKTPIPIFTFKTTFGLSCQILFDTDAAITSRS
jgi:hypothetical protein